MLYREDFRVLVYYPVNDIGNLRCIRNYMNPIIHLSLRGLQFFVGSINCRLQWRIVRSLSI